MEVRFDIHVNLGSFPSSQRGSAARYISPTEMNEFFLSQGITHSLVLYNNDEYELLRELGRLTKTKIYGVQNIMGREDNPTNVKKPFELHSGREYVYGVKIASNRGWWTDGKEVWAGCDYNDPYIQKIFKQLPKNSIISAHTQGTSNIKNVATPLWFTSMSTKYPHLKFIMNHGGDYGPALQTARPSDKSRDKKNYIALLNRHINHRSIVKQGLEIAEGHHNVFIDSSCYSVIKGLYYMDYTQWCVGSDFPFAENFGINYVNERKAFERSCTIPDNNAVWFFESDVDELLEVKSKRTRDAIARYNEICKERKTK